MQFKLFEVEAYETLGSECAVVTIETLAKTEKEAIEKAKEIVKRTNYTVKSVKINRG